MHTHPPPSGIAESHKTLLQVEAYLNYNLDITTHLIDATRSRLTELETQLASPAAQGKLRKTLKTTRNRAFKKLRQCQPEAEMLTRALDEVKSKIAVVEWESAETRQRSLNVYAQPSRTSYTGSPADGMSDRSSSISSYMSSASGGVSLSAAAFPYAPAGGAAFAFPQPPLPTAGPPYIHTNNSLAITTHNLPSEPLYPMPYPISPFTVWPLPLQQAPEPWSCVAEPVCYYYYPSRLVEPVLQPSHNATTYTPAPTILPPEPTTWSFQQSPTSETHTLVPPSPSPKTRRFSAATAAEIAGAKPRTREGGERVVGHRRGVSCNLEAAVREWDEGERPTRN